MLRTILVVLALLLLGASGPQAPSSGDTQTPGEQKPAEHHGDTQPGQRGTIEAPPIVQPQQAPREKEIAPQAESERQWTAFFNARPAEWWTAAFTLGLVIATTGLWFFTGLMWKTIRADFVASHRPNIQIISLEQSDIYEGNEDHPKFGASLRYVNSGETTAYLLQIGWHISFGEHALRPGVRMRTRDFRKHPLKPGGEGNYPLAPEIPVTRHTVAAADLQNARNQGHAQRLRCVGYVLYADRNGKQHRVGFCRIYVSSTNRWDRGQNPDYEYTY